jgi:hydroxymethylpyrimidine pyrophosphatase-like HAD family hydrolase
LPETVLEAIMSLGLELQIIFNKGAVMVLPTGINKSSGLAVVLAELGLSPHNVVGVGDAENDHAFLRACRCSAAVANAVPMLKQEVDIVLERPRGAGVADLIDRVCAEDARLIAPERHGVRIGTDRAGRAVTPDK